MTTLEGLVAETYNRSHRWYAVLVVSAMAVAGTALGLVLDAALVQLGIARGKVARRE